MGKQSGKKKKQEGGQSSHNNAKQTTVGDNSPKDMAVFISMSHELKEEGNKLFQKRDLEGAMLKYEKAIKLLPKNHIDVSYLRSNLATCYMQMGLSEYPRAIHECNLALEVTPKYSKALLKRARCYEALNRLDLALRDVTTVVNMEPNNVMALEIGERVKKTLENKGLRVNDAVIELPPEYVEPPSASPMPKATKEKTMKKKKSKKIEEKQASEIIEERQVDEKIEEKQVDEKIEENNAEDKVVVEERISITKDEEPKKTVKLVFGEDIRWAQLPLNCSLLQVREVIRDRFPSSRAVLIKYRDQEGDLVTITTDEELRWAEAMGESQGSVRLYIVEVNPMQDMFFERFMPEVHNLDIKQSNGAENGNVGKGEGTKNGSCYIDDWIIEFAQLFKMNVGLDSDAYPNLHELGMKVYSEAVEDTVTSEEAQSLFDTAADKFQEMAALALFNWGNVHMSRARKRVSFTKDASRESKIEQIKTGYGWAQNEYTKAGQRYEEALRIKPDLYEGFLALGQQQFERGKLSWYYAITNNTNLETWASLEVLQLYNSAEENMERGMQMWEDLEGLRLSELSELKNVKLKSQSKTMGLDDLFKDISAEEATEQASNMRSQINLLWGTIRYERSLMEFMLGIPVWQECLEVAVEKFELAGASAKDIAIMIKNHCSNNNALEGLGLKIDEMIQAWNEMDEAKKFQNRVWSLRLGPLLQRRVSKIYHALEHV
ncbi:Octicosapeptide/Phox/Bem1p domain-containing protein [Tripterygium wilfordii]|uniref:Octicosapeptide/Phox/Bem1p domain-containing protein n=1 Tax=Tripterygium wilfordii TaxID=458696 RepID=A0A7J7D6Q1_TRIWF|nr:protein PHOX1-like [Tripterygium wilfordii]XP_038710674.1 protein PHOX1-like [Tripterygium wilfordii]KAF5742027.1 Octicosapeptide/Phox/Bem1p domain-containing protein [Tripterygium wilfordii]